VCGPNGRVEPTALSWRFAGPDLHLPSIGLLSECVSPASGGSSRASHSAVSRGGMSLMEGSMDTVAQMTRKELREMIETIIEEKLLE